MTQSLSSKQQAINQKDCSCSHNSACNFRESVTANLQS